MRINNVEDRLNKLRIAVLDPLADARAEERKRFDQAFNMRVVRPPTRYVKTPPDLPEPFSELMPMATQKREFLLEIGQKVFHGGSHRLPYPT